MEKENKNKILNLMVAQHALLEALFFAFRDEAGANPKMARKFLSELLWETKKHFFIEEEAIFHSYVWRRKDISEKVHQLEREHKVMLEMLDKTTGEMPEVNKGELEKFYQLMTGHRKKEEEILYPALEEELSDVQKQTVIRKINEIPLQKKEK